MKLNLGCGKEKYPGFVNIDADPGVNPDLVFDISKPFPYEKDTVDEIWMIHVIEHFENILHKSILEECHRVLKPGGILFIAYPEFSTCVSYYLSDHRGMKEFWKATIFGRQSRPGDYHLALMETPAFILLLTTIGFEEIEYHAESARNDYNTLVKCAKGEKMWTREDVIRQEIFHE